MIIGEGLAPGARAVQRRGATAPLPAMSNDPLPKRIRASDALRQLAPYMSRSRFYGTAINPGPRWTMVDQLDIRDSGSHLTVDRGRFERWLRELAGDRATAANGRAERLGEAAARKPPESYGEGVALVLRAREDGLMSRDETERALRDLRGIASKGGRR